MYGEPLYSEGGLEAVGTRLQIAALLLAQQKLIGAMCFCPVVTDT